MYILVYILIGMIVSGFLYHMDADEENIAMIGIFWPLFIGAFVLYLLFHKIPRFVYRLCRWWGDLW